MIKEFLPAILADDLIFIKMNTNIIGATNGGAVFYYENGKTYFDGQIMYSSNYHSGMVGAPLFQQAFKWFRDKYDFHKYIEPIHREGKVNYEYCVTKSSLDSKDFTEEQISDSYEEAELECIKLLIELCKKRL